MVPGGSPPLECFLFTLFMLDPDTVRPSGSAAGASRAGFMAGSKWAAELGAFINLESTGPAGPDVLFQHTGARRAPPSGPPRSARVRATNAAG